MFVTHPWEGGVLIRGGRFFQKFTEARLVGSTLGGSFLKQRGIYVGMRLEINVGGETILTSPVFSLSVSSGDLTDQEPLRKSC
jgi:hypothetical protein